MPSPKERPNPSAALVTLHSVVAVVPYRRTSIGVRKGLRHTAFFPVTGPLVKDWKLHNGYLKPNRFGDPVDEYWTMRKLAGLWDVTGEEVVEIRGPDAVAVVDELVPRDVRKMVDGDCLYTVLLNHHGGIIEDGILVRLAADRIWWVGGPAPAEQWIYGHALGRDVTVESFHDRIHVASVQGPASRDLLRPLSSPDLGGLGWYKAMETTLLGIPVVITRTGFTAELGYDIYVDVPHGEALFRGLWEHLRPHGVALCGSRALDLRRTEAAIRNIGQEFDWRVTPLEIGFDRQINWRKGPFIGRDALERQAEVGVARKLIGLRLDGDYVAFAGEAILHDCEAVGEVTTANWSPSLEASIAMGFVPTELAATGTRLAIAMDGRQEAATVVDLPFFDPERRLAKA